MIANRFYYVFKPYLPWRLRIALRRWNGRRVLAASAGSWPILETAGQPPANWPGWPEARPFALVLTHDVEGPKGLDRVSQLRQLEEELGFRSAFNLIPAGNYQVAPATRQDLERRGFEVGIHDLHHDGKLFTHREGFCRQAKQINAYLREWKVQGFRAGFMHHNLDWIHDLQIQYDASTFDTDPFEPQPDGVGTIFPFWVPAPSTTSSPASPGKGYMELPYTLVQDFTLFTILCADSIDIWKRKLDWIAQHGGMALVNVHPDYVDFSGDRAPEGEFPARLYRELLEYVRSCYAGQYWHALPREVAAYCREFRPLLRSSRSRRVGMVTYSFYESDTRVMQYARALAARGDQVEVLALADGRERPATEILDGVTVLRLQRRRPDERSRWDFIRRLARFCCVSTWAMTRRHWQRPYDLVHIHNVPDFLVVAALFPRLTGARVILDIHDLMPELYANKFRGNAEGPGFGLLRFLEKMSARVAHRVVIANHLWLDRITARSVPKDRCVAIINHVDLSLFHRRPRTRPDGAVVVLYPGSLQWHQGLDIAIRAFAQFERAFPGAEFHIYGEGQAKPELVRQAGELGLDRKVRFHGWVDTADVPALMANADLGVVPKRADAFGNEAYSTKIMEFMSQGLPVVASRTKIDRYYFNDDVVRFFESGNPEDMARQMIAVMTDRDLRERLIRNALEYAARNSWETRKHDYLRLVDRLIDGDATTPPPLVAEPATTATTA